MEMDRSYSSKARGLHNQTGSNMEPQGAQKRGRPRNTWRRDLDKERARMGVTWGEVCKTAEDRNSFRSLIGSLCSQGTRTASV